MKESLSTLNHNEIYQDSFEDFAKIFDVEGGLVKGFIRTKGEKYRK